MIFRLEYKNREGLQARLDITTPGSSVVKEIEGAENPFVLSYKGDKSDKSFHFMTSSAEINIYETPEFNIDRLKTSSETQIKVDYYIDDDKYWEGFVIPDFFSREIGGAGVVSMTASDRVSTLKGVTLSDLPAMVQIRDLAVRCLEKTGLDLPLKTMADFRATELGFNEYFRSEITSQRLYDSKGRSISCYDILKSILVTSGSTLRQRGGEWHIINKLQHEAGAGRVYSTENTSVDYVESVHHFDEIVKGARRTIIPVAGSVGIYHEYGGGKLHPDNYDFSQGLTGWTPVNGFEMGIEDRQVKGYKQPTPGYPLWEPDLGDVTGKNKLANIKNESAGFSETNLNERPYVKATVPLVYADNTSSIEISANISITSQLNNSVVWVLLAERGSIQLGLTLSGAFEPFVPTEDRFKHRLSVGGEGVTENPAEVAYDRVVLKKGTLSRQDLSGFNVTLRIYGSGPNVTSFVNFASLSFRSTQETAKGVIYKRGQGSDFTKTHDIETAIFGDYLTGGLNGYFYPYPIDDTSSIHNPYSGISSLWTTPYFPTETDALPILQHVVRQQARMFSVAHDLISGEIEIERFDPLSIFVDCNGKRYVIVSASFDFLRSSVKIELEEIAYANLTVRDFIYSYFGEGESGISSVGGISTGTGGGSTGGGLTPEQIEILSWWKKDPDRENTIFTEMNAYSKLELSAYGIGSGSGGGGSDYERLDTWASYDSSRAGWVLSALLGVDLNTRLSNVESGSATSITTTGVGNAITSVSKSGTVITANKGLTFSLSGHTHTISDVTGLQTALNSKLETSIFNTHNTDNVRHITGAERTKWDGVVTDFDNLEIGGRNLLISESVQSYQGNPIDVVDGFYCANTGTYGGIRFNKFKLESGNDYVISFEYYTTDNNGWYTISNVGSSTSGMAYGSNKTLNLIKDGKVHKKVIKISATQTKEHSLSLLRQDSTGSVYYKHNSIKVEKGNKATDWTPAPEDQVSDWNTTDVNSFSFIKNKPTLLSQFTDNIGVASHIANKANPHSVTKAQVGLGNVDNTSDLNKPISTAVQNALNLKADLASPTFTGTVTAPTFIGALSGNATTATTLATARTLTVGNTGKTFDGSANVSWSLTEIGAASLSQSVLAGNGLTGGGTLAADRTITLGTPSTLTAATTNGVTASSHTHAITTTSVGDANTIVQTDATGAIQSHAFKLGNGWSLIAVGTETQLQYNGVTRLRLTDTGLFEIIGNIVSTGEVTAYN